MPKKDREMREGERDKVGKVGEGKWGTRGRREVGGDIGGRVYGNYQD